MSCHGKGQAKIHATAVALHRSIEKTFDVGERHDGVKFRFDLGLGHAENRAIEKDILASSQFRMKTGPHFKQARHPTAKNSPTSRRLGNPAQDLQKRGFSRPIASDDANHLAALDLEAHILQGPEFLDLVTVHDLPATKEI